MLQVSFVIVIDNGIDVHQTAKNIGEEGQPVYLKQQKSLLFYNFIFYNINYFLLFTHT